MRIIKKIIRFVEETLPALLLLTIFISFLLGVFSRYILKSSMMWTQELSLYPYVWLVFLGACYCDRENCNITFPLVYDIVPEKIQHIFHIIGDALIAFSLIAVIPSTVEFYTYYMDRPTAILRIPLGICYFAFAVFQIFTIFRYIHRTYRSISLLLGHKNERGSEE